MENKKPAIERTLRGYVKDSINEEEYKIYTRKWSEEKVIEEARRIVDGLGNLPTQQELKTLGYSSFVAAVGSYSSFGKIRGLLELEGSRRENGYWTLENTLNECKKVVKKEEKFPTQRRLKELRLTSLSAAIDNHGGFHVIRDLLGLNASAPERPKNYWTKERTLKIYKELGDKLGKPPSAGDLGEAGYNGASWNISHKFGGFRKIQKELGFESERKPDGYWTKKRVLTICSELVERFGDLPPWPKMLEISRKNGKYRGFTTGVNKMGIGKIREILKLKERDRPNGYWTKRKIKQEAKRIIDELGYLPTQKEFSFRGQSSFGAAITREYGGYPQLREDLGLDLPRVKFGTWTEKTILSECKKIIRKTGDLPSNSKLEEIGSGALAAQISRNGGYFYFRGLLGLDQNYKEKGYWEKERNVLKEARRIMKENKLNKLPSGAILYELGHSSFVAAISRYHGGFSVFRKKLGEDKVRNKMGSLKKWHTFEPILREWVQELGYFPSLNDARKKGKSGIYAAMRSYHGGVNTVRERMGYSEQHKQQLEYLLENYAGGKNDR